MLPSISPTSTIAPDYLRYLVALQKTPFTGEIRTDYAARLTVATDNSIYQVIPEAVIFPRTTADIVEMMQLSSQEIFQFIQFCPRGGGTSTNGQSLSAGIIIDCSKYMRDILELNLEEKWVRVQPGVVLDQLNAYLKIHGVSFAPEISPSNRATVGGMVNTDACGTGSRLLGRTSDHVVNLTCVLSNGRIIESNELTENEPIYQTIIEIVEPHEKLIDEKFTTAPRTLNGYNLKKLLNPPQPTLKRNLNLNYLFSGSEGTLAIIAECKLKLTPIPKHKKLIVVKYRHFDDALRSHHLTDVFKPLVIEAIDEKLIELARHDPLYFHIKDFIENETEKTGAINLVEFVAHDEKELESTIHLFCTDIENHRNEPNQALGFYIAQNPVEEKLLWELRKKSVGLISKKLTGTRRPIPFVEDTAVPPEKLADYISEFKILLDKHGLTYGMYGHVDAGCVHVRPALDMKNEADEKLMLELSHKVVTLLEKYDGILWGEHGQGRRCEYAERFFGETLYHVVRQIKTLFDPSNQLNPGKIAVPLESHAKLASLSGPLRGQFDKQIPTSWQNEFPTVLACNGNGACFNYSSAEVMCPSYKVTKDRIQSPKGRATVMKEWLRLLGLKLSPSALFPKPGFFNFFRKIYYSKSKQPDFSHEVYSAMSGCLSCKACASQCPLNVDVPEFKAKFLANYHTRYLRPIRDYFIVALEKIAPLQAFMPHLSNWILQRKLIQFILRKQVKLVDTPLISTLSIQQELKKRNALVLNLSELKTLSIADKSKSIILLQDTFTSFYEPEILLTTYDFLTQLGFSVYVAPFFENGKALHVKGFLPQFSRLVKKNSVRLRQFAELNIPMLGIDPSITLTYRDEYKKIINNEDYNVLLLQEFLAHQAPTTFPELTQEYFLLSHCTEKTLCVDAEKNWQFIFKAFGLNLIPLPAGCCGMAGSYGHELEHVGYSKQLFAMDWQRHLEQNSDTIVATGYSCRSQTKRILGKKLKHPIEILRHHQKK